jgi:DNA-binding beta-propeller fold protein YncE
MTRFQVRAEPPTVSRIAWWQAAILALVTVLAVDMRDVPAQTGAFGFVLQRISADDYDEPEGLVLSAMGTHLYVADTDNDVVRVLQPFTLQTLTVISHRSLKGPRGIALGDDRHLYVADTANNRVISYRVKHDTAEPIRTYQKELSVPTGVARSRGRLYIVNESDDSIVIYEPGGQVQALKKAGDKPGEFDDPQDILVAPEGHIIVSDTNNDRIQILSQVLEPLKILHGKPYNFSKPGHMSLDESGNLFIADTGNHRIVVLDADFNIVGQIGTGESGDSRGRLDSPNGVSARNGNAWVSDTGNDRILHYRYTNR